MQTQNRKIEEALASDLRIPRDQVEAWIAGAHDIETLALLYRLADEAYERIEPELGGALACRAINAYLLACIELGSPDSGPHLSRYEAANQLASWYFHMLEMPGDNVAILDESAAAVTAAYVAGSQEVRTAIETGLLEHVFEVGQLRRYYAHWANDPRLAEAYANAIEWGDAHPNEWRGLLSFMRSATEGIEE
jgi:hypothetical protein